MKLKILLPVIVILLFGFLVTSVKAEDGTPGGIGRFFAEPSESPRPTFSPRPDGEEHGRFSLTGGRLKSCEAREDSVKNRLGSLTTLAVMMEGKFDAIALRVEEYYTNKVVPSGKTLPNYQALVDDIAAKRAAVQTALTGAQTGSDNFSCAGDDPKGLLNTYRQDMQGVKRALEAYRTSIKNLIVAVRGLVGGTESPEPKGTAEPTEKPEATPSPVASPI